MKGTEEGYSQPLAYPDICRAAPRDAGVYPRIMTNVQNDNATAQTVTVTTKVVDAQDNVVLTQQSSPQSIAANSSYVFDQSGTITNPKLWYPANSPYGTPYMHKVYHIVQVNGVTVDVFTSPLGICKVTCNELPLFQRAYALRVGGVGPAQLSGARFRRSQTSSCGRMPSSSRTAEGGNGVPRTPPARPSLLMHATPSVFWSTSRAATVRARSRPATSPRTSLPLKWSCIATYSCATNRSSYKHMKIVSLNVGLPRLLSWQGQTFKTGIFKRPVSGRVTLRRTNLDGDRQADLSVHGGPNKAAYAYPSEHYPYWKSRLPGHDYSWGALGENFTTEGHA